MRDSGGCETKGEARMERAGKVEKTVETLKPEGTEETLRGAEEARTTEESRDYERTEEVEEPSDYEEANEEPGTLNSIGAVLIMIGAVIAVMALVLFITGGFSSDSGAYHEGRAFIPFSDFLAALIASLVMMGIGIVLFYATSPERTKVERI